MNFSHIGLVDLVIGLIIVASIVGALRRRAGLIAALASGVGTAVVLWLVSGALIVWGPGALGTATANSALISLVSPPTHALHELGTLVSGQLDRLDTASGR